MIALVDVNNFYASCEKMFNPALKNKPVVVLSNNDGCVIARSDEARTLGIKMGTPAFTISQLVDDHNVQVFSSNYTLYGSMSNRVITILKSFVESVETYSIDEAFLNLDGLKYKDLFLLGIEIREKIMSHTGLPVSIGIAPTKALAKMANRFAKKNRKEIGVHAATEQQNIDALLKVTDVNDIWGIGPQYQKLLHNNGFNTAADFVNAPEEWVRVNMTVVAQRLLHELKGIQAVKWEDVPPPRKNICTSRSFGTQLTSYTELKQPVAAHAATCARKLRQEGSCATKVYVFIETNPFRAEDKQYHTAVTIPLTVPTNSTMEIIKFALRGLAMIYKPGYKYQKAGVMVLDIVSQTAIQLSLFDTRDRGKDQRLMKAIDDTNKYFGDNAVRYAVQSSDQKWHLRRMHLSPRYTTNIDEVMKVKAN